MHPVWSHISTDYPQLRPALIPGPESVPLTAADMAAPETIGRAVDAATARYRMKERKAAAAVWWFSLTNSLSLPVATAMVEHYTVPDLDLAAGQLFQRQASDDYWFGFTPGGARSSDEDADYVAAAATMARSFAPIMAAVSAHTGLRPAPMRAIFSDSLTLAAVGAGNQCWDPYRGVAVGQLLYEGLSQVFAAPAPRYRLVTPAGLVEADLEAAARGEDPVDPADPAAEDIPVVGLRRSCCLIYRSETSGPCLSCPHQTPQQRTRQILQHYGMAA